MNTITETYPISGMHCAACKALIEDRTGKLTGVSKSSVNYATEQLTISYDTDTVSAEKLAQAVSDAGPYKLILGKRMEDEKHEAYIQLKKRVMVLGIGVVPFLITMISMLLGANTHMILSPVAQFVIATPLLFWAGRDIFVSAYKAAVAKTSNMDTLISLGTGTAWVYSTIVTFLPHTFTGIEGGDEVYFEAAVFIIFFIMLGRLLEMRAKANAASALRALFTLQAREARVVKGEKIVTIPLEQIRPGDMVKVKPGEKIPIDGEIVSGETTIDESMITGESIPVQKYPKDMIIGATMNMTGTITYRVTKIGADTMLSQIIRMVQDAQSTKAPIQKLADKVTSVFVPSVIAISIISSTIWFLSGASIATSIYIGITILIIACPCALGLATPTAVMVGTTNAAKKGIIIRNPAGLEHARAIQTIVFDKTGTITQGTPAVQTFNVPQDHKSAVFALEQESHHPLAGAVEKYLADQEKIEAPSVQSFKDVSGQGVTGAIHGKQYGIGNEALMKTMNIKLTEQHTVQAADLQKKGQTVSYVGVDNTLVGVIGISDTIKPEAKHVIAELQKQGVETIILTGDTTETARAVADMVGIADIRAHVLPGQKAATIAEIQKKNGRTIVAMIGDGINDAPAMAQADIAIAMGTGTDVAMQTGDIVLVKGNLKRALDALEISKATYATIKQNLVLAFGYNTLSIPIAAGVLYPFFGILLSPAIASAAMAMSSVSVVLNSLRLARK